MPADHPPPVSPISPADSGAGSFREPKVPTPEKYEGDLGGYRSFILQCGLIFDLQPYSYATDKARIAFVIELLRGRALEWASAVWERRDTCMTSYQGFTAEMRKLFDHPVRGKDAAKRLFSLRQGARNVADFVIEFRTLAVESGWNEESLQAFFYQGLSEQLKDELISYPEPSDLDSLVTLAIRVDRVRERRREKQWGPSNQSETRLPFMSGSGPERVDHFPFTRDWWRSPAARS